MTIKPKKRKYVIDKSLDAVQLLNLKNDSLNDCCFKFACRLNECFIANGKTQEWLAEKTGLSVGSISSYCKGKAEPKAGSLISIANAFETSVDYLLGLTSVKSPDIDMQVIYKKTGLSDVAILKLEQLKDYIENKKEYTDYQIYMNSLDILNDLLGRNDFVFDITGQINLLIFESINTECHRVELNRNPGLSDEAFNNTIKQKGNRIYGEPVTLTPIETYDFDLERLVQNFRYLVISIVHKTIETIDFSKIEKISK